jgi:hypothetical protein
MSERRRRGGKTDLLESSGIPSLESSVNLLGHPLRIPISVVEDLLVPHTRSPTPKVLVGRFPVLFGEKMRERKRINVNSSLLGAVV